jgi:hypothetical protein
VRFVELTRAGWVGCWGWEGLVSMDTRFLRPKVMHGLKILSSARLPGTSPAAAASNTGVELGFERGFHLQTPAGQQHRRHVAERFERSARGRDGAHGQRQHRPAPPGR